MATSLLRTVGYQQCTVSALRIILCAGGRRANSLLTENQYRSLLRMTIDCSSALYRLDVSLSLLQQPTRRPADSLIITGTRVVGSRLGYPDNHY